MFLLSLKPVPRAVFVGKTSDRSSSNDTLLLALPSFSFFSQIRKRNEREKFSLWRERESRWIGELGNGTISIGCSRGKEEKRKRRRVPVDITLARRRDVLQPRRGAHAGFIGRRERERERGREENLCGDSLAGGFTRDEKPNFSLFLFTLLPF